jgi:hypothetical protein
MLVDLRPGIPQLSRVLIGPTLVTRLLRERRNAAEILPKDKILRPMYERLAIHANLFRYALLTMRGAGGSIPM